MRPWQHAKSSAGSRRDWAIDLPDHEFLDSTKSACPDLRHRMVLHNSDLGPALVARVFPERPDARTVALRHVREDLGCAPSLSQWLRACDPTRLPRPLARRLPLVSAGLARKVADAQGLRDEEGPQAVLDLLLLPTQLAGADALCVLCNGAGLAITRAVLGAPRSEPGAHGKSAVFDPAYAAEAIIDWIFGFIPNLSDIIAAVRGTPSDLKGDAA